MVYRIDHTWLVYAFDEAVPSERVELALARVAGHYQGTVDFPLARRGGGERLGIVVWDHPDPACAWPLWSTDGEIEVGSAYVPTGWERLLGSMTEIDPLRLGRMLHEDPRRSGVLNAPLAMAILDRRAGALTIVNDAVGLARLYEMRFEGGWVWSNRLGALPLFAGTVPEADESAWQLLAASGWFMHGSTAIRGARKLPGGSIVEVDPRAGVRHRRSGTIERIVAPREPEPEVIEEAAKQAVGLVRTVSEIWRNPLRIDLTGGRDSRLGAAAAIKGGLNDVVFFTLDLVRGEADVTRELLAVVPGNRRHEVTVPPQELEPDIYTRALWSHLLNDAMRSPETLHVRQTAPAPATTTPNLLGHAGEIAHGFFYGREQYWRGVESRGDEGPAWRLDRYFRPALKETTEGVASRLRDVIEVTLAEGRSLGLEGFVLLDHFYLTERFAHWANLPASIGGYSVFTTPAFMRAAFDLTPRQRWDDVLHRRLTATLVPEWRDIPYFEVAGRPQRSRPKLWERPNDAAATERVLEDDSLWGMMFDSRKIRTLWSEVKREGGTLLREKLFERIIFRVAFEEHLKRLAKQATATPVAEA